MRTKSTIFVLLVLAVLLFLTGCEEGDGGLLYVIASVERDDSGVTSAAVLLFEGGEIGAPVMDATVSINGTPLSFLFLGYFDLGGLAVNTGDSVTLDIQRGGTSISATLVMPEQPGVTEPAGGTISEPVNVSWTSTSNPDAFVIEVADTYTLSIDDYYGEETGTARSHSIPAGTFDTDLASAYVEVSAVNQTSALGSAAAGSLFLVGHADESPTFDPAL